MEARWKILAEGTYLYDDAVYLPVLIIQSTFDFWYEVAKEEDDLGDGELPQLNDEGLIYYVVFDVNSIKDERFWPSDLGSPTLESAKEIAASKSPSSIIWK